MRLIQTIVRGTALPRQRVADRVRHLRPPVPSPRHRNTLSPLQAAPIYQRPTTSLAFKVIATTIVFAASIGAISFAAPVIHAEVPPSETHSSTFRFTDVQKHDRDASEKWVTKGSKFTISPNGSRAIQVVK